MIILKQLFAGYPGILILPDDHTTGNPVPLLVFDAGVGEQLGSLTSIDALYNNGSPLALARDGKLNSIINPITNKTERFAVIGLMGNGWCPPPSVYTTVLNQLFIDYPNLDKTCITKLGLSAGGQNTWEAIGGIDANLYSSAIPMSTPQINTSILNWNNLKAKVWAFHGTQDSGNLSPNNSIAYVNQINTLKPNYAKLSLYNAGHCCWNTYFDPAYTEIIGGIKMNIYQFALTCKSNPNFLLTSGNTISSGTTSTSGITTNITPNSGTTMTTLSIPKVSILKGIATLDPTASTGNITAFQWDTNSPDPITFSDGRKDGGKPAIKTASTFKPFTPYIFTLTVWDSAGGKSTVSISTPTDVHGNSYNAVIPPTKKLIATAIINFYDDGTKEII